MTVTYGGLVLLLAAILLQALPEILPASLAERIGHNSEGLALALVLALWLQFARTELAGTRHEWRLTALAAACCAGVGFALLATDLPSRFRTLNEAFLAAALLIPYVQLRRPLPRRLAVALAAGVLVVVVVLNRTPLVTDLAETLGVLILAPLAFDVVDRGILDPGARTSARRRSAWYGLLVVVPLGLSVLEYGVGVTGFAGEAVRYGVRITEAFVCLLIVELYFAVALGRTGRGSTPVSRSAALSRAVR